MLQEESEKGRFGEFTPEMFLLYGCGKPARTEKAKRGIKLRQMRLEMKGNGL